MATNRFVYASIAALLALSVVPCATAQSDEPEKPEQPATAPEKNTGDPPALPSLDDLLGLPDSKKNDSAKEAPPVKDTTQKRLEEQLDDTADIRDEFKLALKEMSESADRLEYSFDTGTVTQRLQQSIIRRLEDLIEASEDQQSSSSSSQSQSQSQQQPSQPQQSSQSQSSQGSNTTENLPPGGREGELSDNLDTARAAWGSLPERVRDALQQGSGDYFSRLYESLTESYYKRLAEEGSER